METRAAHLCSRAGKRVYRGIFHADPTNAKREVMVLTLRVHRLARGRNHRDVLLLLFALNVQRKTFARRTEPLTPAHTKQKTHAPPLRTGTRVPRRSLECTRVCCVPTPIAANHNHALSSSSLLRAWRKCNVREQRGKNQKKARFFRVWIQLTSISKPEKRRSFGRIFGRLL